MVAGFLLLVAASAPGGDDRRWLIRLQLASGEQLTEHRDEDDRVDWKLPEHRLKRFREGGVVINEEQRLTQLTHASVLAVVGPVAVLKGISLSRSLDVPRASTQSERHTFFTSLLANNVPLHQGRLAIEDGPMAQLPAQPLGIGQRWTTNLRVLTTLGSGTATFEHTIIDYRNGRLQIAVRGSGSITGTEFHLPKLLPGSIELWGMAWYEPALGLVTQESYAIHNRIIKPMEGEDSGFDERLWVDVRTVMDRDR